MPLCLSAMFSFWREAPRSPLHPPFMCVSRQASGLHMNVRLPRERERHTHSSCERFGNSVTSPPPPKHVCALAQLHTSHTLPCSRLPLSSYDCQTTPPPTLCCLHRPLSSHGHKTNQTLGSPVILCVGFSSPLPPLVFIYDGNISCSVYLLEALHPRLIRKPPNDRIFRMMGAASCLCMNHKRP